MPNITNAQAISFSNTQVRTMADLMYTNYMTAKSLLATWNSQALSSIITNDSSIIVDGAATDGRSLITGAMVTNIVTRAQEIITDYEASTNAKLNTVAAVK